MFTYGRRKMLNTPLFSLGRSLPFKLCSFAPLSLAFSLTLVALSDGHLFALHSRKPKPKTKLANLAYPSRGLSLENQAGSGHSLEGLGQWDLQQRRCWPAESAIMPHYRLDNRRPPLAAYLVPAHTTRRRSSLGRWVASLSLTRLLPLRSPPRSLSTGQQSPMVEAMAKWQSQGQGRASKCNGRGRRPV